MENICEWWRTKRITFHIKRFKVMKFSFLLPTKIPARKCLRDTAVRKRKCHATNYILFAVQQIITCEFNAKAVAKPAGPAIWSCCVNIFVFIKLKNNKFLKKSMMI